MCLLVGVWIFLLELCAWWTLAQWGWQMGQSTLTRWALAFCIPGAALIFWGTFLSPKAAIAIPELVKADLRFTILASAALLGTQLWPGPTGWMFLGAVVMGTLLEWWVKDSWVASLIT